MQAASFQCVAIYEIAAETEQDLSLVPGDVIEVDQAYRTSAGWWQGRNVATGLAGYFPSNYVRVEEKSQLDLGLFLYVCIHKYFSLFTFKRSSKNMF